MPLKKGQTNNPNGRPKGSKNKVSGLLRTSINEFLEVSFPSIVKDIKKLSPKERVKAYTDLLQYGLPKLHSTAVEINYEEMSDEQLNYIIEKIISRSLETKPAK